MQPPSFLNLVFTYNPKTGLQYAREFSTAGFFSSIPVDPLKSVVALFYCELIYKSVTESETDPELFDFIRSSFQCLDDESGSVADFPLHFLVELSKYQGFFPLGIHSENTPYFDLQSGKFCRDIPSHQDYLDPAMSLMLSCFTNKEPLIPTVRFSSGQRYALTVRLIEYYRLHLPGFSGLKSPAVIRELFR